MNSDMKRELSLVLQNELDKQIISGETLLISLPGSFGEALAVTDRRAFVIRDQEVSAGGGCEVNAYSMNTVKGAEIVSTPSGGYIELKSSGVVSGSDKARVYFPSYEITPFQAAAEFINGQVTAQAPAVSSDPFSNEGAQADGEKCPKCGAAVDLFSVFCGQCGEQIRVVCTECSASSPKGSLYCSHCGSKLTEYTSECTKCGTRLQKWFSFCTSCGSSQHQNCLACGSQIQPTWTHCAACGRLLGSAVMDPNTARSAQRRLDNLKESMREEPNKDSSVIAPNPTEATPTLNPAAQHNQRGNELFDNEDLEGAIREFKQAVALDPGNASYHCNLAIAYDENDQDDLAFDEYFKAIELDPKDTSALLSLGYMYNERDERDKAEEVWNRVIQIAPGTPESEEARRNIMRQDEL